VKTPRFVDSHQGFIRLAEAVMIRSAGEVREVLADGADVNEASVDGITPLQIDAEFPETEITHLLLDAGALVNTHDKEGNTAVSITLENGNVDKLRLLLAHGANPKCLSKKEYQEKINKYKSLVVWYKGRLEYDELMARLCHNAVIAIKERKLIKRAKKRANP
jgi:ankyrin repeat protein